VSFDGEYREIKPNAYLKYADRFDDANLPGEMTYHIWFKKTSAGTGLKILHEGFPK
jgi:uncharacterized protein YndB with AHSA1/START domain